MLKKPPLSECVKNLIQVDLIFSKEKIDASHESEVESDYAIEDEHADARFIKTEASEPNCDNDYTFDSGDTHEEHLYKENIDTVRQSSKSPRKKRCLREKTGYKNNITSTATDNDHLREICNKCGLILDTAVLIDHTKDCKAKISNRRMYECKQCEFKCFHTLNLSLHMKRRHAYECSDCDFATIYKSSLNSHLRIHTGERPFKCSLCDYKARTSGQVKVHVANNHSKNKPYKCDKCEYCTTTMSSLNKHKYIHSEIKPFICNTCGTAFKFRPYLRQHIQTYHREKQIYTCSKCDYKCDKVNTLKNHMTKHSKRFRCSQCCYSSVTEKALKGHVTKEHNPDHVKPNKFKCDECNYSTSKLSCLTSHRQFRHTKEKPFKCDLCESRFTKAVSLKRHTYTHSDGKPFKCCTCSYQSTTVRQLMTHVEIKHANVKREKKYKCDKCEYAAVDPTYIITHKKYKHSTHRPFKCDLCDVRCLTASVLKKHKKTHDKKKS